MVKKYERKTVNHHVAGSIPARGAIISSTQDSLLASNFRYAREISFDTPLLKFFALPTEKVSSRVHFSG